MNELPVMLTLVLKIELLRSLKLNYSKLYSDNRSEIDQLIGPTLGFKLIAITKRLTPLKNRFC